MCGVAGVAARGASPPPAPGELERMCDAMRHRGPDSAGYWLEGAVGLGMRRLAIIDVAGGRQPIHNEDGSAIVVFNGEIYNFRELRAQLQAKGHRFATASDTEVIVHLWEQVGSDFPRHLNGMFAIALYDRLARRLLLARDHVGIKPLYYALGPQGLVFGSELKVLLASGRLERRLDVDALGQFVSWEYVPGAATLLREVRRLEPASLLEYDVASGRARITRYWSPLAGLEREPPARTPAQWEDRVDDAVGRAVRAQLVSEVPLGAFLSGGVDSSLVVSAMGAAQTFSIGFDDASYDETPFARRVAQHLGVEHTVEVIRPRALELCSQLLAHLDDPIADSSIFPTYLVSRLARERVTVALSGDGGDELFGGYESYRAQELARTWQRAPRPLRAAVGRLLDALPPAEQKKGWLNKAKRFAEGAALDPDWGHARWRVFCDEAQRALLFTPAARAAMPSGVGEHIGRLAAQARALDPRRRALYVDFGSYLVDNCLAKVDRMSMACSLEVRVPLLERELVELAFQLPPELLYDARGGKRLLRRVAARHVPRACIERPKEGFSIPLKHWLRAELRELAESYLAPARLREAGLFEAGHVRALWDAHCAGRANHSHLLWAVLLFEQWRERWGAAA